MMVYLDTSVLVPMFSRKWGVMLCWREFLRNPSCGSVAGQPPNFVVPQPSRSDEGIVTLLLPIVLFRKCLSW